MPESCAPTCGCSASCSVRSSPSSGGQDLLDDVERLRKAVIARPPGRGRRRRGRRDGRGVAARPGRCRSPARSPVTSTWPTWPRSTTASASCAARHRGRRAARVAGRGGRAPGARRRSGSPSWSSGLELHPVLTAHPTEARRRAVVTAIQRISAQLAAYNAPGARRGRARARPGGGCWRRSTCCGGPPSCARTKLDPLDEVRTAMAAFDETLFRVVPAGLPLAGRRARRRAPAPARRWPGAFIRYGSWIGGDRDGNPNVTAKVTREAIADPGRARAASRWRPPAPAIGRTLTAAAALHPGLAGAARRAGRRRGRPPRAGLRARHPLAARAAPAVAAVRRRTASPPPGGATSTSPTARPTSSWPTCGWPRPRWPRRGRSGRRTASCST